ncbi:MAG: DeoR/GlpR family DNA-binding transcription regulator [Oscillospiraceae bacterium]|nr:DeoR/GlpR family DNA-binding transcription regulator [Oscillospiraceae bacterium]
MFKIERQREIIDLLKENKSMLVTQMAKTLYIGEATIRRDLDNLEKQGLIKRTYGGAVWLEGLDSEIPLHVRESHNKLQKDSIGKAAAKLITDGDVVIMDSSSTTYSMVKYLSHISKLTVITNGAKTAVSLGKFVDFDVYSTGGRLRKNSLSYSGDVTKSFISDVHANILFFSCRSFSAERGLFDASVEEAELRRIMIKNSDKKVLLCDSSKFSADSFYKVCGIDVLDYVITDADFPDEDLKLLEERGVACIKCNDAHQI